MIRPPSSSLSVSENASVEIEDSYERLSSSDNRTTTTESDFNSPAIMNFKRTMFFSPAPVRAPPSEGAKKGATPSKIFRLLPSLSSSSFSLHTPLDFVTPGPRAPRLPWKQETGR